MAPIVITAINARYSHPSLGSRRLLAGLGELRPCAELLEFDLRAEPGSVIRALKRESPRIAGFGLYIWNRPRVTELLRRLRRELPKVMVVLGGPETRGLPGEAERLADTVIEGEAEQVFPGVCRTILAGGRPPVRVKSAPPDPRDIQPVGDCYNTEDLTRRAVYVETSRGCPYACDYCLSALDRGVRFFPLPELFRELDALLLRGARTLRFVDRVFNLDIDRSLELLEFLRPRAGEAVLHFELVPERLPERLLAAFRRFAPGCLHLEVGVQTFDPQTAARVNRPLNPEKVELNLRRLSAETGAVVHADLIAGLPGESLAGIGAGFDRLLACGPREIQLGILKRLPGAPIERHDRRWNMRYDSDPPYAVHSSATLPAEQVMDLKHFAYLWNRMGNSGDFPHSLPLLWGSGSPFTAFMAWSRWVYRRRGRVHALALLERARLLLEYLTERGVPPQQARQALAADYFRGGRRSAVPRFLRE